jgi:hypothetical protein
VALVAREVRWSGSRTAWRLLQPGLLTNRQPIDSSVWRGLKRNATPIRPTELADHLLSGR